MFCTNCGNSIPDHEQFCANCGRPAAASFPAVSRQYAGPTSMEVPAAWQDSGNKSRKTKVALARSKESFFSLTYKALLAFGILLILAFGWVSFSSYQRLKAFGQATEQSASTSERLAQASARLNKKLPQMHDSNIRVDSTSVGPGNQFIYNYTLVNMSRENILLIRVKRAEFAEFVTTSKCSHLGADQSPFPDPVTFVYAYRDSNGNELVRVPINKNICSSFKAIHNRDRRSSLEVAVDMERLELPRVSAEGIRMDTIDITGPKEVKIRLTLPIVADEVDTNALKSRENILLACSKIKSVLAQGITYIYDYRGSDGIPVGSIHFDEKICKDAP